METPRIFGPEHMRVIELPVEAVIVDPTFNCRRAYTTEQIEQACDVFEAQPMLHTPTVARVEGEWRLVAGFLRFAVWRAKGVATGLFRLVEAGDLHELAVLNMVENLQRHDLEPAEIVEGIMRLRDSGLEPKEIAQRCGCSSRWVRRISALKRDAHPELWAAFIERRSPHLTLTRVLDLADHRPEEQLRLLRLILKAAESADELAHGYREAGADGAPPPGGVRVPSPRRRYPVRRRAVKTQRLIQREPTLEPAYRRGLLDAFGFFLSGEKLPFRFTVDPMDGEEPAVGDRERAQEPGDRAAE